MEIEERKLAAIMFTDIVAFSAMAQENEGQSLELLAEHNRLLRPIFRKHSGQEIKAGGDGFMVEFASALNAASCAIDIQRTLAERNVLEPAGKRLYIRIGVHVGDVVHREGDVFGDAVNIASRIEPLAGSGGICISHQVYDQIQNKIAEPILRLGRRELKNIQTPVDIYMISLAGAPGGHLPLSEQWSFTLRSKRGRRVVLPFIVASIVAGSYLEHRLAPRSIAARHSISQDEHRTALLPLSNIQPDRKDKTAQAPRALPTRDPQAYDLYLHGKFYLDHESKADDETAIRLLKQAVARDPTFAQAYAALARAYNEESFFFAKKQSNVEAFVAVNRALELDPNLAAAHLAQAKILWTPANHFPHGLAIQEFRRALALNPDFDEAAEAHEQLAQIYLHIGLFDKPLHELQQALRINPVNNLARFRIGVTYCYQGNSEQALAVFDSIPQKALLPNFEYRVAEALFYLGRQDEALTRAQSFLRHHPDGGGLVTSLEAILFAAAGKQREAEDRIRQAIEIGKGYGHFHHTAYNIASAYALMYKNEPAIHWLQTAVDEGLPCYPLFERDPNLNNLRTDPHFFAFMAQLKKQWEHYRRL